MHEKEWCVSSGTSSFRITRLPLRTPHLPPAGPEQQFRRTETAAGAHERQGRRDRACQRAVSSVCLALSVLLAHRKTAAVTS